MSFEENAAAPFMKVRLYTYIEDAFDLSDVRDLMESHGVELFRLEKIDDMNDWWSPKKGYRTTFDFYVCYRDAWVIRLFYQIQRTVLDFENYVRINYWSSPKYD